MKYCIQKPLSKVLFQGITMKSRRELASYQPGMIFDKWSVFDIEQIAYA